MKKPRSCATSSKTIGKQIHDVRKGRAMITHEIIDNFSKKYSIGETLRRNNKILTTERSVLKENVRILSKHRDYCRVTNGKYETCISWIDLLREELGIFDGNDD